MCVLPTLREVREWEKLPPLSAQRLELVEGFHEYF